jgi:hypothetical protein
MSLTGVLAVDHDRDADVKPPSERRRPAAVQYHRPRLACGGADAGETRRSGRVRIEVCSFLFTVV